MPDNTQTPAMNTGQLNTGQLHTAQMTTAQSNTGQSKTAAHPNHGVLVDLEDTDPVDSPEINLDKGPEKQDDKRHPITLTQAAIDAARAAIVKRGTPGASIRLAVKGGGCNGYSYVVEFEDNPPGSRDRAFETGGVRVVVDRKSLIYLIGSVLDYEKTMMKQGFKFKNPNEATSCSCGTSFTLK